MKFNIIFCQNFLNTASYSFYLLKISQWCEISYIFNPYRMCPITHFGWLALELIYFSIVLSFVYGETVPVWRSTSKILKLRRTSQQTVSGLPWQVLTPAALTASFVVSVKRTRLLYPKKTWFKRMIGDYVFALTKTH